MSITESFQDSLTEDFFSKRDEINKFFEKKETPARVKAFKKEILKLSTVPYKDNLIFSPLVVKGYNGLKDVFKETLDEFCKMTGFNRKSKIVRAFVLKSLLDQEGENEGGLSEEDAIETIINAESVQERSHNAAKMEFTAAFKPLLEVIRSGNTSEKSSFEDDESDDDSAETPVDEIEENEERFQIEEEVRREVEALQQRNKLEEKKNDLLERYPDLKQLERKLEDQGILEELKDLEQWPPEMEFKPENDAGPRVFSSKKPFLMKSKHSERKAMVIYVDAGPEGLKPRFIYTSTTHIAIKSLPRAIVNREGKIILYDKADSEESISLKMPYQMELIDTINREDIKTIPKDGQDEFIKKIVRHVSPLNSWKDEYRQDTFFGNVQEKIGILPVLDSPEKSDNTARISEEYARPNEVHLKDSNKKYDPIKESEKYLPAKLLKRTTVKTLKYGEVDVFFYQSQQSTHSTNYMVCRVPLPRSYRGKSTHGIMISAMDPTHEQANTYLTSKVYLGTEGVTVPMLEKVNTIIRIGDESMYLGNAFLKKFDCESSENSENDFIMWNYLRKLPVIRTFASKIASIEDRKE